MSRPCASHGAQLISIEFFKLLEYAVRTSAIAISSTIASTACLINSTVGLQKIMRALAHRPRQPGGGGL